GLDHRALRIFFVCPAEDEREAIEIRMVEDGEGLASGFEHNLFSLVKEKQLVCGRDKFEGTPVLMPVNAGVIGRVLYLGRWIERWHGWQRLARALRPHELQRILRHW